MVVVGLFITNGNSQPANHQPASQLTSPNYKLTGWLAGWWVVVVIVVVVVVILVTMVFAVLDGV